MWTLLAAVVAAAAATGTASSERAAPRAASESVRPVDAMAKAAFNRGWHDSHTFTRLVDKVERSGVIVHVETSLRLPPTIGGQLFFVTQAADGSRYLRIRLNARASAFDMAARLGHELQHAVEVAHGGVRDGGGLARLYRAIGTELEPGVFDTAEARDVEERVKAELFGRRTALVAAPCPWMARREGLAADFRSGTKTRHP
jgi:hypothetical protein